MEWKLLTVCPRAGWFYFAALRMTSDPVSSWIAGINLGAGCDISASLWAALFLHSENSCLQMFAWECEFLCFPSSPGRDKQGSAVPWCLPKRFLALEVVHQKKEEFSVYNLAAVFIWKGELLSASSWLWRDSHFIEHKPWQCSCSWSLNITNSLSSSSLGSCSLV